MIRTVDEVVAENKALKAEVEELRADKRRLDWVLPILSLTDDDDSVTNARSIALAGVLLLCKRGRAGIDAAMEAHRA